MQNTHIDLDFAAFKTIDLGKHSNMKTPEYLMDFVL